MDKSAPATILVVDDDEDIAQVMQDFLEAEGFRVFQARDGHAALDVARLEAIDCVLLDVMMPGLSGLDVLRQLREDSEVPVIILSARGEDSEKIRGLGLGADDYVVKSVTPSEVVARVQAVVRRTRRQATTRKLLDFGRLVIDLGAREVVVAGSLVTLTAREFDLLAYLAQSPRQVFTREQLLSRFWGEYGSEHSLTVHVGRIREKIEQDPARPRHVVTVWGVGYRFEGMRRR